MSVHEEPPMSGSKVKYGYIKEVVVLASVNGMSARVAAKHFKVNPYSIYRTARRMGVRLPSKKTA
jgi:transposase